MEISDRCYSKWRGNLECTFLKSHDEGVRWPEQPLRAWQFLCLCFFPAVCAVYDLLSSLARWLWQMSLLKAELELITAPCPFHLPARPSTLPLWVVFHTGECEVVANSSWCQCERNCCFTVSAWKKPFFWEKQKIVCFSLEPKVSDEGQGPTTYRIFSVELKETRDSYISLLFEVGLSGWESWSFLPSIAT